jgi:hypothetical protein
MKKENIMTPEKNTLPIWPNPPLSGKESEDYYNQAEQDLRSMSKYDHPGHNDPQWQPGGSGKSGCPLLILVLASSATLTTIAIKNVVSALIG